MNSGTHRALESPRRIDLAILLNPRVNSYDRATALFPRNGLRLFGNMRLGIQLGRSHFGYLLDNHISAAIWRKKLDSKQSLKATRVGPKRASNEIAFWLKNLSLPAGTYSAIIVSLASRSPPTSLATFRSRRPLSPDLDLCHSAPGWLSGHFCLPWFTGLVRELTYEENSRYGFTRVYGGSPTKPHFLAEDEKDALLAVDDFLSSWFCDRSMSRTAIETLAVVASNDARDAIRHKATDALASVVSEHLDVVRLPILSQKLGAILKVEIARPNSRPEIVRSLSKSRSVVERLRNNLPVAYRVADEGDALTMAKLFDKRYYGADRQVLRDHVEMCAAAAKDEQSIALVAELDSAIVGMAVTRLDPRTSIARLDFLAVEGLHNGCGIGKELVNRSMSGAVALGANEMTLACVDSSPRQFYTNLGFQPLLGPDNSDMARSLADIPRVQTVGLSFSGLD